MRHEPGLNALSQVRFSGAAALQPVRPAAGLHDRPKPPAGLLGQPAGRDKFAKDQG